MKVFILVVITKTYMGQVVSFQEFNSLKSCQVNAEHILKRWGVDETYCTEK